MQRVLDCLHMHCGLEASSRIVDVGAGIGRRAATTLHACSCFPRNLRHVHLYPAPWAWLFRLQLLGL